MNLIDALGESGAEHAVCTTYPFEPLFFSNYVIDSLQDAGVATPVVLMDDHQYEKLARQQQLTSRAIGQHYYLEPVTVEDTFHPKVTFLAGESTCHVCVTSANITLGEYTTAAQLGQTATVAADSEQVTAEQLAVTQGVRSFIEQLSQEYVSGRDHGLRYSGQFKRRSGSKREHHLGLSRVAFSITWKPRSSSKSVTGLEALPLPRCFPRSLAVRRRCRRSMRPSMRTTTRSWFQMEIRISIHTQLSMPSATR